MGAEQVGALIIQIITSEDDYIFITALYKPSDTDNNGFLQAFKYLLDSYCKNHVIIGDMASVSGAAPNLDLGHLSGRVGQK